ncbi:hypothetical protein [Streptomyces sp. NPDC051572]|uniref:hypothetical protein n=1 Tax=Streptomyces sp. NPDC051572 TaxID=3155802 RepID=UPI00344E934B
MARPRRGAVGEIRRPPAAPPARELTGLDDHAVDLRAFGALDVPVTPLVGALNEDVAPFVSVLPRARVVAMPGQGRAGGVGVLRVSTVGPVRV